MRTPWKLQSAGALGGPAGPVRGGDGAGVSGGHCASGLADGRGAGLQPGSLAGRVPSPDAGGGRELYAPKLRSAPGRRRVDAALRCRWKRRLAVEQARRAAHPLHPQPGGEFFPLVPDGLPCAKPGAGGWAVAGRTGEGEPLEIQRGVFPALYGPAPRLAAGDVFPGAVLRAGPGWPAPAAAVPPGTAGAG